MKPDDVSQEAWGAACDCWEELASSAPLRDHETVVIARAITAAVAAEREAYLDAASTYLQEQYGFAMLSHPVDRARIAAIRARVPS